jgi:hypothetical protein
MGGVASTLHNFNNIASKQVFIYDPEFKALDDLLQGKVVPIHFMKAYVKEETLALDRVKWGSLFPLPH